MSLYNRPLLQYYKTLSGEKSYMHLYLFYCSTADCFFMIFVAQIYGDNSSNRRSPYLSFKLINRKKVSIFVGYLGTKTAFLSDVNIKVCYFNTLPGLKVCNSTTTMSYNFSKLYAILLIFPRFGTGPLRLLLICKKKKSIRLYIILRQR